jgi:hypothetical protein
VLRREFPRAPGVARRNRDDFGIRHIPRRLDQRIRRNPRRAEDSESQWTSCCHS